jgi:hypothetical protein
MIRRLTRAAALVIVLAAGSVRADELRMTTLLRTGTLTNNVGDANIVVRDVVGDSRPDVISCANGSAFAMSYNGSSYRDTWYSPNVGCTGVAVGDRNGDGSNQVFVGTGINVFAATPSYVYVYDATSYGTELAKVLVSATEAVNDIAVGNVDGDAGLEVVAATNTKVFVFNAATLALKWTASYGGHTVAIGDLEGDGVNEIVIAGANTGYVLDASAQTLKWSYPGGFGPSMALGDVDNDGKAEILCGTHPYYSEAARVINGDTMTVITVPSGAMAIAAGDANNDGQRELIIGQDQFGAIQGYSVSATAATKLWSIPNPDYGVQGLAVGDSDGDGKNDVLFGTGALSSAPDKLFVADANTQSIKYTSVGLDGPFHIVAGDLDGDGKLEMVVVSQSPPAAWVLDYATHRLIATLPFSYNTGATEVAIGQVDGDPQKEIIFLGGAISVFDGKTFAQEWTSPSTNFDSQVTSGHLIVKNIDGDSLDEIFYVTGSSFHVLNGAGPFIQYSSTALDSDITDFAVADLDGDGVAELVVGTLKGVYVFKTSDWSQRLYIPLDTFDSRKVSATAGHFGVTLSGNGLALYSGSTLAQEWICPSGNNIVSLAFADLAGQSRLAAAMSDGTLRFFPLTGATCPSYDTMSQSFGTSYNTKIAFHDVDNDGRPELLVGTSSAATLATLGWSSELRGDADADGLVTDSDIDALAAYFYGNRTAIEPAADVNADGTIRPDDLFYLINFRRGTGAPPPASAHDPGVTQ